MLGPLFAALFITLILIVALGGGLFFLVYWNMIQRPVPKLTGEQRLPGLSDTVEIVRDKHAIPHVYGKSDADILRAQGYLHAQERFWQMEQARRTAQGTLAEIFGSPALEADRFSRVIGFQRAAEAEAAALDDDTQQALTWYAAGVNAYLQANPGKVAAEVNLLRYTPELWTPADTVAVYKVFAWGQSINWESELTRLRLLDQLGPIRAAELEPDLPAGTPIILEAAGSADVTRMVHAAGLLLNQYEEVKQWFGVLGEGQGSNSWAVAAKRTLNGRALLCSDPHLPLQIPGIWYENALHGGSFAVSGVSLPGVPGILMGHNASIAWGLTNALVDVQDLFAERAAQGEPGHFVYADTTEAAHVQQETIVVRRKSQPHVEQVIRGRHGPIITGLLADSADSARLDAAHLALCWSGHTPGTTIRAILGLNRATDWVSFNHALDDWCDAPQNVTYADVDGHIGYRLAGRIPRRAQNLGLLPTPGWLAGGTWRDWIPVDELPRCYNPESGIIVTANNKMVGDDYPYFLGIEFMAGWRAARIEEMLRKKARHSIRDMEEIQLDTESKFAHELAPWLGTLYSDDPWEKFALNALRTWNYRMDTDSAAALVFHYTLLHLLEKTFGDKVGVAREGFLGTTISPIFPSNGFMSRAELRLAQLINEHEESIWYTDVKRGQTRTRTALLQEALTDAVRYIRKTVGDSTLKWDWGRSHQIRYVHSMGSANFLRGFFNRGPFPIGGDGTTPLQTRHALHLPLELVQITPSCRLIVEVGNWDSAEAVLTSGQSGHPLSDHYDDQIAMYREGVYHRMPWSDDAVEEAAVYRMRLVG